MYKGKNLCKSCLVILDSAVQRLVAMYCFYWLSYTSSLRILVLYWESCILVRQLSKRLQLELLKIPLPTLLKVR